MRPRLLVDMNLSPQWIDALQEHGWQAIHWSDVGDPRASDREIMDWAAAQGCIVLTHDLDFGTMLALSHESGPSIMQVRHEDVLPSAMAGPVLAALEQHEVDLTRGALVVVDALRSRVRILPI